MLKRLAHGTVSVVGKANLLYTEKVGFPVARWYMRLLERHSMFPGYSEECWNDVCEQAIDFQKQAIDIAHETVDEMNLREGAENLARAYCRYANTAMARCLDDLGLAKI